MQFLPQKAIKRQVFIDFLVENPAPGVAKLNADYPDKVNEALAMQAAPDGQIWQLYFDGASRMGPDALRRTSSLVPYLFRKHVPTIW